MYKHYRILDFALTSLLRQKMKNAVIILAFALNVFLVASILLLTDAMRKEAVELLKATPELIIQKLKGGRHELIPINYSQAISKIRGIRKVIPRYWGYYYDPPTGANCTFMSADEIPPEVAEMAEGSFCDDFCKHPHHEDSKIRYCIIGQGIAEARFIGTDDIIPVRGADGEVYVLKVAGIFKSDSVILTNDLVILSMKDIKAIFDIPDDMATDLVVKVRNAKEVDTVARKIQELWPAARIISKSQILSTYEALFGWRSGLMVALIIGSVAAFAILAWNKASGLSAEERKEIGALKAVGWDTSDVLNLKFWEGFAISMISFLTGVIGAYIHIFYFGGAMFAPVLRNEDLIKSQTKLVIFAKLCMIHIMKIQKYSLEIEVKMRAFY
ncbi:ABC transporter permease, partial [Desulfococcaceae bacterium HSG7]|nr:ABC transporter permease [Desulfococcaceae bacterium HSG7]